MRRLEPSAASSLDDCRDAAARGLAIQVVGLVDDGGGRNAVRQHGQLPREPGVERIERVDTQALRLLEQRHSSSRSRAMTARASSKAVRSCGCSLGAVVGRSAQRAQHAAAHFGSRFAREGDGDDLLGLLHGREQREVALDQELGLARARRRLNDERLRWIERSFARGGVAHGVHQRGTAPRATRELLEHARQRRVGASAASS